jgi:uncharacterized 2Fe-2S/4Fe-4S cluster protein (DUF4445 family)
MNEKKVQGKIKIDVEPIGKRISLEKPTNGLKAIVGAGIGIKTVCGGQGVCGKCRIIIMDKNIKPPNSREEKMLSKSEIDNGVRLSCQQVFDRDMKIYIPASSLSEEQKLQVKGVEKELEVDPPVKKYHLKLKRSTLEKPESDLGQIKRVLESEYNIFIKDIDFEVLKMMPDVIRKNSWDVTVAVRDGEIINIEGGDSTERSYGIAVDLGTTKIAIFLMDLNNGKTMDSKGVMNPQISFGEDVMSRINFAMQDPESLDKIQSVVVEGIREGIKKLCSKNSIKTSEILEMTVVGNTAMHHLLLGFPVRHLGLSPFVTLAEDPLSIKAREIKIDMAPGAYIYIPPPIAGFVGSDHLAMILSTGIDSMKGNYLGVDIGTNTEIALAGNGTITSVSTASGPAFEGAQIRYGMRAAPGAIERVIIDEDTFVPTVQTINDKPAAGICGSGILDSVAELLRTGLINERGKFNRDSKYLCRDDKDEYQFILAHPGDDNGSEVLDKKEPDQKGEKKGSDKLSCDDGVITITQKDVVEIQLAKGAIRTGIDILLENADINFKDIDGIIIAGAFGSYIDPRNVMNIGMFPMVGLDKISQVGNAAGVGSRMVLLSNGQRRKAESIAKKTKYLELTVFPSFTDHFVTAMQLPKPKEII